MVKDSAITVSASGVKSQPMMEGQLPFSVVVPVLISQQRKLTLLPLLPPPPQAEVAKRGMRAGGGGSAAQRYEKLQRQIALVQR